MRPDVFYIHCSKVEEVVYANVTPTYLHSQPRTQHTCLTTLGFNFE